jgi:large subunit ribosomal protein L31
VRAASDRGAAPDAAPTLRRGRFRRARGGCAGVLRFVVRAGTTTPVPVAPVGRTHGGHDEEEHPPEDGAVQGVCEGQVVLETYSTRPEVHVDVWSGNHPFYTGQQRFIDTEGRVEKFQKRFGTSYRK